MMTEVASRSEVFWNFMNAALWTAITIYLFFDDRGLGAFNWVLHIAGAVLAVAFFVKAIRQLNAASSAL